MGVFAAVYANTAEQRAGADSFGSSEACIICESRSNESIRGRDGCEDGYATYRKKSLTTCLFDSHPNASDFKLFYNVLS